MKITICTGPWFPTPPGKAGAVERRWGEISRYFARRGHEVTVLSRGADELPLEDVTDGVRTIRLRTRLKKGSNVYVDILKDLVFSARMWKILPPADIVVTNAFWLPVMARFLKPGAGRVVMNIARVPKGQLALYSKIDRFSAVSKAIGDMIKAEQPKFASRVRVICNPVNLDFFYPPPSRKLTPGSGTRTILYTGRVHPEKGLENLIDAFGRLSDEFSDLALRIVGPWRISRGGGGPEYTAALRARAGSRNVVLEEPIFERAALSQVLQEASYYCYPSLAEKGEAFGVAPLEAMATGLAPVLSKLECFREFLVEGENGLAFDHRSGDPVANLTAALRSLIVDPERTARMGAKAAEMSHNFSYDLIADQYLADFEELLATPRPALRRSKSASVVVPSEAVAVPVSAN